MKVLDASVVTDALALRTGAGVVARQALGAQTRLHAPAILSAEIASVLRGMERRAELSGGIARAALLRAKAMRVRRYPFEPFANRVWELRADLTVYDAWYVALAEALGVTLVTSDERLRASPGPTCPMVSPSAATR